MIFLRLSLFSLRANIPRPIFANVRNWISLLFFILLISHQGLRSFVLLQWKMNQAEIIQKHCENRSKPQMACNGKCHLRKTLAKLDQSNNQKPSESPSKAAWPSMDYDFPFEIFQMKDRWNAVITSILFIPSQEKLPEGYHSIAWKPPSLNTNLASYNLPFYNCFCCFGIG